MTPSDLEQPLALQPSYQNYAWGDAHFIPELFGLNLDGQPYAEAWFGAHPRSPSLVSVGPQQVGLDQLLRQAPRALLGRDVSSRFGGLPYLLKVLAAACPLSIQVHPSREQAKAGFLREERQGIGPDAAHRNYRDQNHKPELLVALTPFFALAGFREAADIRSAMVEAAELRELLPALGDDSPSLQRFVASYLRLPQNPRASALGAWLSRLERRASSGALAPESLEHWVLKAHSVTQRDGAPDPGLFFFLLLNLDKACSCRLGWCMLTSGAPVSKSWQTPIMCSGAV